MYIREDETPVFKLHEQYESISCTATARAAMARSIDSQSEESTDESLGVLDCGASITITGSLLNCVDVEEHKTIIETAKEGESIMATHVSQDIFCEESGWGYGIHNNLCNICQRIRPRFNSW